MGEDSEGGTDGGRWGKVRNDFGMEKKMGADCLPGGDKLAEPWAKKSPPERAGLAGEGQSGGSRARRFSKGWISRRAARSSLSDSWFGTPALRCSLIRVLSNGCFLRIICSKG